MSPDTGLYVHVPFCPSICPYCDFAVTLDEPRRRGRYVDALLAEAELLGPPAARCDTLYLGGGTPSRLDPAVVARLRSELSARGWLAGECRVFLEANPEDVRPESVRGWRNAGVGTLSLGVQSFDDDRLSFLGRRHSSGEARRAVEAAREAGFDTLSIDLMYGHPGQSEEDWRRELDAAIALAPDHISCYQLTIHEGTMFGRRLREGRLHESSEELRASLFLLTHEHLAASGYEGYEVSNFASSPRHRSRHNEKYWRHAPYVGLGPSAHSFDGRRTRRWNERSFFVWERKLRTGTVPEAGSERLDEEALLLETLMLRLRTRAGLDLTALEARFGVDALEAGGAAIGCAIDEGRLLLEDRALRPTTEGLAVADALASVLFDALEAR